METGGGNTRRTRQNSNNYDVHPKIVYFIYNHIQEQRSHFIIKIATFDIKTSDINPGFYLFYLNLII